MFKKGTILRTSLCWNLFRCENLPTVLMGVECMDNEALVRALRKFEQQNESLKKAVSALQSEADARDYLVTQILLGLNVP